MTENLDIHNITDIHYIVTQILDWVDMKKKQHLHENYHEKFL